ncbi:MAG TPA: hypothetical protein ENI23_15280 [bacterium]|nr:hypothetical protein [bacterium]
MSEEESGLDVILKKKHLKGLTGMFKSIKGAGDSSGGLLGMFTSMEALSPLLKPLEIIMKIIGSLFGAMAAEILPPLLDALDPIFEMLMDLTPLFAELGVMIGELVAEFLPPLVKIFLEFILSLKPLVPAIFQIIKAIMELAIDALPILINIFMVIVDVILSVLKPVLDWLGSLNAAELSAVLYAFGLGLSALWGLMHFGPIGAAIGAAIWAGVMTGPLLMRPAEGRIVGSVNARFAEGGFAMGPIDARVGDVPGGEIIAPLTPFNRRLDAMITAQEETNILLSNIYAEKKFRHQLSGGW